MAHVFVSYKREDKDFALQLRSQLQGAGFEVWIDENIPGGKPWLTEIEQKLRESFVIVVVVSPKSMDSEWVNYEWIFARGAGIHVIPLYLRKVEKFPCRLDDLNFVNFMDEPKWGELFRHIEDEYVKFKSDTGIHVSKDAPSAVRRAAEALDSHNSSEREDAIKSLAQSNAQAAIEVLIQATVHNLEDVRLNSAEALSRQNDFDDVRALSGLIEAYTKDKLSLTGRVKALQLIKKHKFDGGLEVVMRAFTSHEVATQSAGAEALDEIFDENVVPTLLKVIVNHETTEQKNAAVKLIYKYWEKALPALISVFDLNDEKLHGETINRINYIVATYENAYEIAINELEKAFSNTDRFLGTKNLIRRLLQGFEETRSRQRRK